VLGGIIVVAAGMTQAVVRYDRPAAVATAWFLAAGVAVYVAGLALFRFILRTGPLALRLGMAAVALVTAVIGLEVTAEAQIVALTLILGAGIALETRATAGRRPLASS
jgi:hypothetical protein